MSLPTKTEAYRQPTERYRPRASTARQIMRPLPTTQWNSTKQPAPWETGHGPSFSGRQARKLGLGVVVAAGIIFVGAIAGLILLIL